MENKKPQDNKKAFSHEDALRIVKGNFFKEEKHKDNLKKEITYDFTEEKIVQLLGVVGSRSGKETVPTLIRMPQKLKDRIEPYIVNNEKGKAIILLLEYALDELEKTGKGLKGVISKG